MSLEIVVITGMSGSGKSLALRALEDSGYYCVDNLPPELLASFVALEHSHRSQRVAVAMDVRSATALPLVPQQLNRLRAEGVQVRSLFLDASTGTLVRRFSETRRRHPLSQHELPETRLALVQTIELERQLLAELREQSYVIDTSVLRPAQLLTYVKELLAVKPGHRAKVWLDFDTLLDLEMRKQITHSVKAIAPFAVTEGPVVFALKVATWDAKESKRVAPSPIEWKKATPKGKPLEIGKLVEKVWND